MVPETRPHRAQLLPGGALCPGCPEGRQVGSGNPRTSLLQGVALPRCSSMERINKSGSSVLSEQELLIIWNVFLQQLGNRQEQNPILGFLQQLGNPKNLGNSQETGHKTAGTCCTKWLQSAPV